MFTAIVHFSIKKKLFVGLTTLFLLIGGIYAMLTLPIDAVPDITNNQVQIVTVSPTLDSQSLHTPHQEEELPQLFHSLKKQENYKTHFLIPIKGDKLLPVSVDMIQLFYIKDCQVKAVLNDGTEYNFPQTLDELTDCLNPHLFFRANRQYLVSREAIKDIDLWFNSRLSINVRYSGIKEKILVSKARVAEFKEWFSKKQ